MQARLEMQVTGPAEYITLTGNAGTDREHLTHLDLLFLKKNGYINVFYNHKKGRNCC